MGHLSHERPDLNSQAQLLFRLSPRRRVRGLAVLDRATGEQVVQMADAAALDERTAPSWTSSTAARVTRVGLTYIGGSTIYRMSIY